MFSTIDTGSRRFVFVTAISTTEEEHRVMLRAQGTSSPRALRRRALARFQQFPTESRALALAKALWDTGLVEMDRESYELPNFPEQFRILTPQLEPPADPLRHLTLAPSDPSTQSLVCIGRIEVRVLALRFNPAQPSLWLEELGVFATLTIPPSIRAQRKECA